MSVVFLGSFLEAIKEIYKFKSVFQGVRNCVCRAAVASHIVCDADICSVNKHPVSGVHTAGDVAVCRVSDFVAVPQNIVIYRAAVFAPFVRLVSAGKAELELYVREFIFQMNHLQCGNRVKSDSTAGTKNARSLLALLANGLLEKHREMDHMLVRDIPVSREATNIIIIHTNSIFLLF